MITKLAFVLLSITITQAKQLQKITLTQNQPKIIAHRGYSGKYPEHTIQAYQEGAKYADIIECDLAITKDRKLICLHDSWFADQTNADEVFANDRPKTSRYVKHQNTIIENQYFSIDFTLNELKKLTKVHDKKKFHFRTNDDDQDSNKYKICTFGEFLTVAYDNQVDIYVETKNQWFFNNWLASQKNPTTFEDILFQEMLNFIDYRVELGLLNSYSGSITWYVQSFFVDSLITLKEMINYNRESCGEVDYIVEEGVKDFVYVYLSNEVISEGILQQLRKHQINNLGLNKKLVLNNQTDHLNNNLFNHYHSKLGFKIYIYTMRNEAKYVNQYQETLFQSDWKKEMLYFLTNFPEISGYFTDFPEDWRNAFENQVEFSDRN